MAVHAGDLVDDVQYTSGISTDGRDGLFHGFSRTNSLADVRDLAWSCTAYRDVQLWLQNIHLHV